MDHAGQAFAGPRYARLAQARGVLFAFITQRVVRAHQHRGRGQPAQVLRARWHGVGVGVVAGVEIRLPAALKSRTDPTASNGPCRVGRALSLALRNSASDIPATASGGGRVDRKRVMSGSRLMR